MTKKDMKAITQVKRIHERDYDRAVAEKDELHIALEEGILEILGILFVFEGNKCLGFDSRQIEYYAGLNTSKARK